MHNDNDVGFTWAVVITIVAIATALIIAEYTGLTDAFINSFS